MKKKIKVLHVSVRLDIGGGTKHVCQLIRNYPADIESYVAGPRDEPYWNILMDYLGPEKMICLPHRKFSIKALYQMMKFIVRHRIDIIHSDSKGGGIYARLAGIMTRVPVVHTFNGIHIGEYNCLVRKLYLMIEWLLGKATRKIIAVSTSEKHDMIRLGIVGASKITVINNCIDIPVAEARTLDSKINPFQIICIGRFTVQKNPSEFISIAALMKKKGILERFKFLFIGDGGDLKDDLMSEVSKLGLESNIVFIGQTDDVYPFLRDSSLYLTTSRWEGLPLAVIEAMSVGLPVVATDTTGNRDLVREGVTGFLYHLSDIESAVKRINMIVDDPVRYKKMSCSALEIARNVYDVKRMIFKMVQLYESITG